MADSTKAALWRAFVTVVAPTLPDQQLRCVFLYAEGRPLREIARVMNIDAREVARLLADAVMRVQQESKPATQDTQQRPL